MGERLIYNGCERLKVGVWANEYKVEDIYNMPICKTCKKLFSLDTDECLNCAGSDPSLWHEWSGRRRLRV